jgi:photosystem II stability/assembly factor-like uncharacterized protein
MGTQSICLALVIVLTCPFASGQWVQTNNGLNSSEILTLAVSGTNLFAGTARGGVFLSTNSGDTWTSIYAGLRTVWVSALAVFGTNLYAGTLGNGVLLSTDNGKSWTAVNSGLPSSSDSTAYATSFAMGGMNLFVTMNRYAYDCEACGTGVFRSTDSGTSWTFVTPGMTNGYFNAIAVSDTNLFAGTNFGVFLSTNNGASWATANVGLEPMVHALAVSGTNLFAGTFSGVFLSTNNGTSWTVASSGIPPTAWVEALAVSGTNLFAGTWGEGVFLSTNNGVSWTDVSPNVMDKYIYTLAVRGPNLFAGTLYGGVWKRPLSEMITNVEQSSIELPREFLLRQNYPNPFNPSTTIKFELPRVSHVSLAVYDVLGREVSVLVNERRDTGVHEVKFDGSNLASGVYFCRIQAGEFAASKRMLVLK